MPTDIEWPAIALRLALTAIASAAIGINRGELDGPVGLRTTMLVALSAAISMIQVNLLLPTAGNASDSRWISCMSSVDHPGSSESSGGRSAALNRRAAGGHQRRQNGGREPNPAIHV